MPFVYSRVVRFHETDAAGVVYFANLLTLCHEAYEAALAEAGIDLKLFFSQSGNQAVPVVHTSADFYRSVVCGEAIAISLTPRQISPDSFEIDYEINDELKSQRDLSVGANGSDKSKPVAIALTRHVCITTAAPPSDDCESDRQNDRQNRPRRCPLTPELVDWIARFGSTTAAD